MDNIFFVTSKVNSGSGEIHVEKFIRANNAETDKYHALLMSAQHKHLTFEDFQKEDEWQDEDEVLTTFNRVTAPSSAIDALSIYENAIKTPLIHTINPDDHLN